MAKQLIVEEHTHAPDMSMLYGLDRSRRKTVLIYGLTATLWGRFFLKALIPLLKMVNVDFIAIDRFPPDSKFVVEALLGYGLPFRARNNYSQADLKDDFQQHASLVRGGCIFINGEWIKVDAVICTTTPNFNLRILELWATNDCPVYLDKPLVSFDEAELVSVEQIKRRYPGMVFVADFFVYSPVLALATGKLLETIRQLGDAQSAVGVCYEPWTLAGEQTESGNRGWMFNPAICKGVGLNDCGVHAFALIHYLLTLLGYQTSQYSTTSRVILGRYEEKPPPMADLFWSRVPVETGAYAEYNLAGVPLSVYAGKGLEREPHYGGKLLFSGSKSVGLMVGTPRFDPHVAVETEDSVTVHKLANGGLGYTEIALDFFALLYGGASAIHARQANIFAAMHAASSALNQSYLVYDAAGSSLLDYPVGGTLPGIPNAARLVMPMGLLPDNDLEISF